MKSELKARKRGDQARRDAPDFETLAQRIGRDLDPTAELVFRARCDAHLPRAKAALARLYGHREDFEERLAELLSRVAEGYIARPESLRRLDLKREAEPDWFQRSEHVGYVAYADRFAGSLKGVNERVAYLRELGVTYLHLMPLLRPRPGESDGGYAVMDYREVDPALGSMADLRELAASLRAEGISLCVDLVCNHTAKEHPWARAAAAGDPHYGGYYHSFPDRTEPDRYEEALPEVFPDFAPGNFSYCPEWRRWVWTTFHEFQWDLDYGNPDVFAEMLDVMVFLANQGVDVLRLDAVAFLWKRLGTDCQNQPEVHELVRAFRALLSIAAPGVLLKAEAIVSPDVLVRYFGSGDAAGTEHQLAYHNALMVLLWSSVAERRAVLMTRALQALPPIPARCAWVSYVRCHDDIGWAVRDEDAAAVGLSGPAHRAFLSDFYSGRFPGSFAWGEAFQHNPKTGDRRISGMLASLAGLEAAEKAGDAEAEDLAVRRALLLYGVIFAYSGIPLVYMGDEVGLPSDRGYTAEPDKADDNRWLHRPRMDWARAEKRHERGAAGRIFAGMRRLANARKRAPSLHAEAACEAVWTGNAQVFGLLRSSARGRLLVLANVSEAPQTVARDAIVGLGVAAPWVDRLRSEPWAADGAVELGPYDVLWLESADAGH